MACEEQHTCIKTALVSVFEHVDVDSTVDVGLCCILVEHHDSARAVIC